MSSLRVCGDERRRWQQFARWLGALTATVRWRERANCRPARDGELENVWWCGRAAYLIGAPL